MKIEIGDIFEQKTILGLIYIHVIGINPDKIHFVRILDGIFHTRPDNFNNILEKKEIFIVQFYLKLAIKENLLLKVGNSADKNYSFPNFVRSVHAVRGIFLGWHIVNTQTFFRKLVKELSEDQKNLSPEGIWSPYFLNAMIEKHGSLENWI